jgi:hypothetical protein
LSQICESPEDAFPLTVAPEALIDETPGVLDSGATWWLEPAEEGTASRAKGAEWLRQLARGEADTVQAIPASAAKLPGLALERLGYDPELNEPALRARSLREATDPTTSLATPPSTSWSRCCGHLMTG